MRIRATVLTPFLAVVIVAALVSIGIVVDHARQSDASVALLDSIPESTEVATPATSTAADTELTGVAVPMQTEGSQEPGGPSVEPTPVNATTFTGADSGEYDGEESDEESEDEEYEPDEDDESDSDEIEDD